MIECLTNKGTNVPISPKAPLISLSVSEAQKLWKQDETRLQILRPMELIFMCSIHYLFIFISGDIASLLN